MVVRDDLSFLENSVIVAAHPDDEMLWFNAIVGRVNRVIIVFKDLWAVPGLGEARERAVAALPLPRVDYLRISEPGTYGCADWTEPQLGPYGLRLGLEEARRELARIAKHSANQVLPTRLRVSPARVADHYAQNYAAIRDALADRLSSSQNVFTHNPWGEYGHEDHVQLFRVLHELRERIGFRLWMSNYCTERALPLAMRYFQRNPGGYVRLPCDKELCGRIADVYRRSDCWTWADDWAFFDEECYMQAPLHEEPIACHSHLFPLNLFTIDDGPRASRMPLVAGTAAVSAMIGAALMEVI